MIEKINKKYIALILITVLIISSSGFYVWYTQYRNWSIEELDDKAIKETRGNYTGPSIKSDMAGEKVTVEGKITSLETYSTNQGDITIIELDDYEKLSLFKEGKFEHKEGDHITIDVEFKNGYLNGKEQVFSPQLSPELLAVSIQRVNQATTEMSGLGLDQKSISEQPLRVTVENCSENTSDHLPASLNETTCRLYSGGGSLGEDYEMLGGEDVLKNSEAQLISDYGELSDQEKRGGVKFNDSNDNSVLDKSDYFEIDGLERPDTSLSINTYHFIIDTKGSESQRPPWDSYIILNEEGFLISQSVKSYYLSYIS